MCFGQCSQGHYAMGVSIGSLPDEVWAWDHVRKDTTVLFHRDGHDLTTKD